MENLTLKDVLDLGASGILIVIVWRLWMRLNVITDRMFIYLESAKQDRREMRRKLETVAGENDNGTNGS